MDKIQPGDLVQFSKIQSINGVISSYINVNENFIVLSYIQDNLIFLSKTGEIKDIKVWSGDVFKVISRMRDTL